MDTVGEVMRRLRSEFSLEELSAELVALSAGLPVGLGDQIDAAMAEAAKVRREIKDRPRPTSREHAVLIGAVLIAALGQRKVTFCSHLLANPAQVGLALLGPRVGHCKKCLAEYVQTITPDTRDEDGLCDFCQNPTDEWWPVEGQLGPLLVHGDICDACREGLMELYR